MFIANLTYIRPLEEVDALIPAHIAFLDEHYESGTFIASGRKVPRTGGVILIAGSERGAVIDILDKDPFKKAGVADYELLEFIPTKMQAGFENLI